MPPFKVIQPCAFSVIGHPLGGGNEPNDANVRVKGDHRRGGLQGKSGRLKKEGLGAEFEAVITDEQIVAETAYQIGSVPHRERITISRYTGKIENIVVIGKTELVHYGQCKQLPGRMF
jgi:hypothetical protein